MEGKVCRDEKDGEVGQMKQLVFLRFFLATGPVNDSWSHIQREVLILK